MKKKLTVTFKIILSIGILYFLFNKTNTKTLLELYSNVNLKILILPFILLFFQTTLSSLKWKYILAAENTFPPFFFLLKSYFIAGFLSLFLPSSFGGDIYRIYILKQYNKNYLKNTSSVLFDRISGLFALTSISIISYILFYKNRINYKFLAIYLFAIILFWLLTSDKMANLILDGKNKIFYYIIKIIKSFNKYRNNKKVLLQALCISFIFQSNIVLINKICCMALNIEISVQYLFMIIPLIYLTEALPISINGLGVREGAFIFFFVQAGYKPEEALGLAILVIMMRYLFNVIIGGGLFVKSLFSPNLSKE